jgi:hypothetical protein
MRPAFFEATWPLKMLTEYDTNFYELSGTRATNRRGFDMFLKLNSTPKFSCKLSLGYISFAHKRRTKACNDLETLMRTLNQKLLTADAKRPVLVIFRWSAYTALDKIVAEHLQPNPAIWLLIVRQVYR